MNRRAFLYASIATALGMPRTAKSQQAGKVQRIAFLSPAQDAWRLRELIPVYLIEAGFQEGINVRFEHRFAVGSDEALPALAKELVALGVDLVVTAGMSAIGVALDATSSVPIVAVFEDDPVASGLVTSVARPGRNASGVDVSGYRELIGKRLEILRDTIPGLSRVGVIWNPEAAGAARAWETALAAGHRLRLHLQSLEIRQVGAFEAAFSAAHRAKAGALLILTSDGLIWANRTDIIVLAAKMRLPAIYPNRAFVDPYSGGLMSYSWNRVDVARMLAIYIEKVLRGTKPADLPIQRPSTFELVINLKTARALGLTIPPSLLLRADQVIE